MVYAHSWQVHVILALCNEEVRPSLHIATPVTSPEGQLDGGPPSPQPLHLCQRERLGVRLCERFHRCRRCFIVPGTTIASNSEETFFIDNLLVQIHFIIVMFRWIGLAPRDFEFPFPGSLTSTFLPSPTFTRTCFPPIKSCAFVLCAESTSYLT